METITTYGVGPDQPTYNQLREQNRVLRQLVQDVVNSGVAFEDGRIPYKEVQIDRMWFDDAQAALTATSQPTAAEVHQRMFDHGDATSQEGQHEAAN